METRVSALTSMDSYTSTVYSRLGLLGNPSDGMKGAAVAISMENFFATVKIEASERIEITPHVLHDASSFDSLKGLSEYADVFGYYGGRRLLMVCKSDPNVSIVDWQSGLLQLELHTLHNTSTRGICLLTISAAVCSRSQWQNSQVSSRFTVCLGASDFQTCSIARSRHRCAPCDRGKLQNAGNL